MSSLDPHLDLLGRPARDRVTGFEGVATVVSFDLYGCIQVAVHPRVDKDGKIPDGKWLDVHRVEIWPAGGARVMAAPIFAEAKIDGLGTTVRDRVTGFEGVVASITFNLNGVTQVAVHPRVDKDGKIPDGQLMDIRRVEPLPGNIERAMPVPNFAAPVAFGATPQTHQHGPAEKPDPADATVR